MTLRLLDREVISQYNLTIVVSDTNHTSSIVVIVDVVDVNDEAPTFENDVYDFTVAAGSVFTAYGFAVQVK